jgi:hypothetical protein
MTCPIRGVLLYETLSYVSKSRDETTCQASRSATLTTNHTEKGQKRLAQGEVHGALPKVPKVAKEQAEPVLKEAQLVKLAKWVEVADGFVAEVGDLELTTHQFPDLSKAYITHWQLKLCELRAHRAAVSLMLEAKHGKFTATMGECKSVLDAYKAAVAKINNQVSELQEMGVQPI